VAILESLSDTSNDVHVEVKLPFKLKPIAEACRYKILYGGRGGAKSRSLATQALMNGIDKPLRILCAREVQKSIKQSVHQLLSDLIQEYNLGWFYEVIETEIRGKNGTQFFFAGLAGNTVESIKSFEGADICWVEEGQTVTKRSWDILIPTIRKPLSEIWVSFNPFMDFDNTYVRFVINPPEGALVIKINWSDNKWFPEELNKERLYCLESDPENYPNIWEGECLSASEMQFITTDSVRQAMDRGAVYLGNEPLICGVDLARGGDDDCFIYFRRGKDGSSEKTYKISGEKSRDSMKVVSLLAKVLTDHQPDQINIDEGGLGGPIVDRMNQLGWNCTGVNFGGKAMDEKHYANRSTEMWARMRKWIVEGGSLKYDERLKVELTSREFSHDNKDRIVIESKRLMKKDGRPSPDFADAVALTFAINMGTITRGHRDDLAGLRARRNKDSNPLDAMDNYDYD
jgi:hypothetical protein